MLSPKDIADFDQSAKLIVDSFPSVWWGLYSNLLKEGFDSVQALDLLKTYILSVVKG